MSAIDRLIEVAKTLPPNQGLQVINCMLDYIQEQTEIRQKVKDAAGLMLGTPPAEIRSTTRNHIAHPSVEGC